MNFDWFALNHDITPEQICEMDIKSYSKIKLLNICQNSKEAKEKYKLLVYWNQTGRAEEKFESEYCVDLIPEEIERLSHLGLLKPKIDINKLPEYSFFLQFKFTLATPYISRDDEEFYVSDNPVRKDKVFKVPMVSGSIWKGNLRWVMRRKAGLIDEDPRAKDSDQIIRLFGNEKGNEKEFNKGRLNFYPTFFDKISLEVINPHDRKTKAGINPIYIESVPEDAKGIFSLLYVPFDLMGNPDARKVRAEVAEDLSLIRDAVRDMMLTYGFSAKKSNGFGVAMNQILNVYHEVNGVKNEKDNKTAGKKKSKMVSGKSLKDLKKITEKKAKTEQETFNNLKNWFDSAIAELEQSAVKKDNNNG